MDIKLFRNVADQCRALGLKVGDTIEGTGGGENWWYTTRLTLLWLGVENAAWMETHITHDKPEWSKPRETSNWSLSYRDWRKI